MSGPSDEKITMAVWDILRGDLNISRNELKSQIEAAMGWNLDSKKVSFMYSRIYSWFLPFYIGRPF
jgi:hypothetical protein